jgi:hypothetical protein
MPARPALCNLLLPTGKTCTQPALRREPFCRFHNDARSRRVAEHYERMFAISDESPDAIPNQPPVDSMTHQQPRQNQRPPLNPSQLNDVAKSLMESMISPRSKA